MSPNAKWKITFAFISHRSASQLSDCGGAGTGCGWCVPFLRKCFEADSNNENNKITLTAEEYEAQRAAYRKTGSR